MSIRREDPDRRGGFVGTCDEMCPESEKGNRQLSIFERTDPNNPDGYVMVKEYRRAGADQDEPLAPDLRTPRALQLTMKYLAYNIMNDERSQSQEHALEWYDFLWDRLRAIRKDITQQNICDEPSTRLIERCARFHIHSCYVMNRVKDFDVDMNKRHLNDCLQMLRQMYTDLKLTGVSCRGELEFQKYDLLLHLDDGSLMTNVTLKTSNHRSSSEMKFIIQVYTAYTTNNFYRFFKLLEQADYLTSSILSLFVTKVRVAAIKIIVNAFSSRQVALYPAHMAIDMLGFDDLEDLESFVLSQGLELREKNSKFYIVLQKNTSLTHKIPALKSKKLVESKISGKTNGEIIYGDGPLEELEPEPINDGMDCSSDESSVSVSIAPLTNSDLPFTIDLDKPQATDTLEVITIDKSDDLKQALKISNLKPADVAAYHVKAEDPLGKAESEPTNMTNDRSMRPSDEPVVTDSPTARGTGDLPKAGQKTLQILSIPEEIAAGAGSSPQIIAEIAGKPLQEVKWFKDCQPIEKTQPSDGHLKIVDLPSDQPDVMKQSLKINNSRPADVAAYQTTAEITPVEAEQEQTNVTIDCSIESKDKLVVEEHFKLEDVVWDPMNRIRKSKRKLSPNVLQCISSDREQVELVLNKFRKIERKTPSNSSDLYSIREQLKKEAKANENLHMLLGVYLEP